MLTVLCWFSTICRLSSCKVHLFVRSVHRLMLCLGGHCPVTLSSLQQPCCWYCGRKHVIVNLSGSTLHWYFGELGGVWVPRGSVASLQATEGLCTTLWPLHVFEERACSAKFAGWGVFGRKSVRNNTLYKFLLSASEHHCFL